MGNQTATKNSVIKHAASLGKPLFIDSLEAAIQVLLVDELEILRQLPEHGAITRVKQTGPGAWQTSSIAVQYLDIHRARVMMQKDLAFIQNHDWWVPSSTLGSGEVQKQSIYSPDTEDQPF